MSNYLFSQNTYPQVRVIEGDTLVLITPIQLNKANHLFLEKDYFQDLSISLDKQVKLMEESFKVKVQQYSLMEQKYQLCSQNQLQQDQIINLQQETIKKFQKQEKKQKWILGGSIVGGVTIGIITGLLLSK